MNLTGRTPLISGGSHDIGPAIAVTGAETAAASMGYFEGALQSGVRAASEVLHAHW